MKSYRLLILLFIVPISLMSQNRLSVEEAVRIGLENNYNIQINKVDVDKAVLLNSWGQAGRFPQLSFIGKATNRDLFTPKVSHENNVSAGVNLSWVLFDGFRVNITKSKLADLQNLSEGNAMVVIENTVQSIILAYYQLLLNQSEREVLKTIELLSYDRMKYVESQREVGTAVKFDFLQAKNNYLEDKAKYLRMQMTSKTLQRNLAFLIGDSVQVNYDLTASLDAPTQTYFLPDLERKMRRSNRNLMVQYLSLAVVEDDYKLSKSGDYPSIALNSNYNLGYGWADASGQWNGASVSNLYVEMGVRYNLFNGGIQKRAKKIAKYNVKVQELRVESIWIGLKNQLLNQHAKYLLEKELLFVAEEAEESALLNLKLAKERYDVGAINSFNYRDVQIVYQNAALAKLRSKYRMIESNLGLVKLTGGLLSEWDK
ncbi:TolC family protein [Halosquirtibacter laminarini]|uniref:TolC family protein n=1 Tax=Halosquirtibacter laminarini TaxID=3374600 RepID=A0AC61NGY6_9BACT|nr:TolC family protein [Prolixibacteraceae bacterium]